MRKVILYIATSIDGFIAKEDGSLDWLDKTPNPDKLDYGYYAFNDRIDTTLMGYQTYAWVLDQGISNPYPDKKNYVFSRQERQDNEYISFISGDMSDFVRALREQEGKDIWLVGGGKINSVLLNSGLIDEMIITIMPVVLGSGIPLFSNEATESYFNLHKVENYGNGVSQFVYGLK